MDKAVLKKVSIFGLILLGLFSILLWQLNKKSLAINEASKLLSEFKTARALEVLSKARGKSKSSDKKLDFLIIYANAKTKNFDAVEKDLERVKALPKSHRNEVKDFLKLLSINDRVDLLTKAMSKSRELKFGQNYFIQMSRERSDINEELKILEAGTNYLNGNKKSKKVKIRKIDDYLLRRYMDIGKIFMGNKNPSKALEYLLKAQKIKALPKSQFKDDYYLNLGLAYRGVGKKDEAYKYLKLSAAQGNSQAKEILRQIKQKYIPRSVAAQREEEEKQRKIRIKVIEGDEKYL